MPNERGNERLQSEARGGPQLSDEERKARERFFRSRVVKSRAGPIAVVIAYLFSAVFVALVHRFHDALASQPNGVGDFCNVLSAVLIGGWTIGPPVYFFLEYMLLGDDETIDVADLPDIDAFKYTREMARNFWIAAVAILAALATGYFPGGSR